MAKCEDCNQEMLEADGCTITWIRPKNTKVWYKRLTTGYAEPGERCHDCNAKYGETHHFGCDEERCPKCGGQIISCDCFENGAELTSLVLLESKGGETA